MHHYFYDPCNQSPFTPSKHEKQIRQTQTFILMSFKKYVGVGLRELELRQLYDKIYIQGRIYMTKESESISQLRKEKKKKSKMDPEQCLYEIKADK